MKKANRRKKEDGQLVNGIHLSDEDIGRIFLYFVDQHYRDEENLSRVMGKHESDEGHFIEDIHGQVKEFRINVSLYPERLNDYLISDYAIDERFLSEKETPAGDMYEPIRKALSSYDDLPPALEAIGYSVKTSPVFTGDFPKSISTKFRIRKKQLKRLKSAYEDLEDILYSAG